MRRYNRELAAQLDRLLACWPAVEASMDEAQEAFDALQKDSGWTANGQPL